MGGKLQIGIKEDWVFLSVQSTMSTYCVSTEHKNEWKNTIPEEYRIRRVTEHEFFSQHYNRDLPCIIEGVNWKCTTWTTEDLNEELGRYVHMFRYEEENMTISINEYLSKLFKENNGETRSIPDLPTPPSSTEKVPYARHIGPLHGKLASDVEVESLFPKSIREDKTFTKYLFLGAASTKTNNHYDWTHNLVVCVKGVKHVCLLPPKSEKRMINITEDTRNLLANGSCYFISEPEDFELDICHPMDPDKKNIPMHEHPVLKNCPGLVYSPLFPGDVVFFPAYWYHYFHNVTSTVSVTIQTS